MPELRPYDKAVRRRANFVAGICLLSMVMQALGYIALGTGRAGMSVSEVLIICQHLIALACAWEACRRAHGTARLFWLLFLTAVFVLMVPCTIQALGTCWRYSLVSDATWRALYLLYGAPVLMMLILPDNDHYRRVSSEIFLDLVQVALVVGLAFSILFYLPLQQMLPTDALQHNLTVSNLVSVLLLLAVLVRLRFARFAAARDRLLRLGIFLLTCAVVTFIGNWIDQHHYTAASAWWDLGWDLPIIAASMVAVLWQDSGETKTGVETPSFMVFFGKNLALVAVLFIVKLIVDQWSKPHGAVLTNTAIVASLVAFTLRLALTQHAQQQEIAHRKTAQDQLTDANHKIGNLLEEARRQTSEITRINELVSLLQACSAPTEVYNLASECLHRLFPGASGCLSRINPSTNQVHWMAEWGPNPPSDKAFASSACWALRRGSVHASTEGSSAVRCCHLSGEGPAVCIPLIANGTAIGTLAIQQHKSSDGPVVSSTAESDTFSRRCDLIVAVGQHVALALANLELREALRVQAVRDSLTGLYNRRYMQEFLHRETMRASRKNRPVSILALDLDNFKLFNDTHGHAAGDQALSMVGEFLLRSVRSDDVPCRSGGEEFIIILPECSLQQAITRAEQIRTGLQERRLEDPALADYSITVSIGVAAFDETTDRVDRLLACADEALYQAKREGRNRVVAARAVTSVDKLETGAAAGTSS